MITSSIAFKYENLSQGQKTAVDLLDSGENLLVLGAAGTGKSFLIKTIEKRYEGAVLCGPTGMASRNIDGVTLHSFFRVPFGLINPHEGVKIPKQIKSILESVKLLMIDEIGMVRSDVFAYIDACLKTVNKSDKPFGGVQVVLFGDLFQLGPVVVGKEAPFFGKANAPLKEGQLYSSPWFFNSPSFYEASFKVIGLTEVFRQKNPDFVKSLHGLRKGIMSGLPYINENCNFKAKSDKNDTVITTTNSTADAINQRNLSTLAAPEVTFLTKIYLKEIEDGMRCVSISNPPLFKRHLDDSGVSSSVTLKVGARVMIYRHSDSTLSGLFGEVVDIYKGSVNSFVDVKLDNEGGEISVELSSQPIFEYRLNAKGVLEKKEVGKVTYMPLILGWALTVHKMQGQTMDEAYIKNSDRFFCHGQAYVALSRVKEIQNLYLERKMRPEDFIVDEEVIRFLKSLRMDNSRGFPVGELCSGD